MKKPCLLRHPVHIIIIKIYIKKSGIKLKSEETKLSYPEFKILKKIIRWSKGRFTLVQKILENKLMKFKLVKEVLYQTLMADENFN